MYVCMYVCMSVALAQATNYGVVHCAGLNPWIGLVGTVYNPVGARAPQRLHPSVSTLNHE